MSPKPKIVPSSRTFARSSALHGAGSVGNLGGRNRPINTSPDRLTADARALGRDWAIVGGTIAGAYRQAARRPRQA